MLHTDTTEKRRQQMQKDDAAAKQFAVLVQKELKLFSIKATFGENKTSEDLWFTYAKTWDTIIVTSAHVGNRSTRLTISVGARDTYYTDTDDREVRIGNIPLNFGSTRDLYERVRKAIGNRKKRKNSADFYIKLRVGNEEEDAQNVARQISWVLSGISTVFDEQKKP